MATSSIPTLTLYWEVGNTTYAWGGVLSSPSNAGAAFDGIERVSKEIEKRRDVKNIRYALTLSNID